MPHLSQNELDFRTKKEITEALEMILGKMDKKDMSYFLSSLLSATERLMLAKRMAIATLLKEDADQASIANALNITRETVTRIELSMMKRPRGFELAFEKIRNDKLMEAIKKRLLSLASYSIKVAGGRV